MDWATGLRATGFQVAALGVRGRCYGCGGSPVLQGGCRAVWLVCEAVEGVGSGGQADPYHLQIVLLTASSSCRCSMSSTFHLPSL